MEKEKDKEVLVVRNIDKRVYRKFKHRAIQDDMSIGQAITDAMIEWLEKRGAHKKLNPRALLAIEGIIKPGKPVRWSEQIDEMLYG